MVEAEQRRFTTQALVLDVPNVVNELNSKSLAEVAGIVPLESLWEALLTEESKWISFQSAPWHARVETT